MTTLTLKNVWKKYGDVIAVKELNLSCEDGEFFSLLGPSGCGKSSTLRMIAGLEEITDGEIWFDDTLVNNLEPRERNVAMVFETYALYPFLSVYENIVFPLRIRGLSRDEIDKKVRWAADFLGISDILRMNVKGLSSGQKQSVGIGRAIVREPSVLLMDEPISHLEARQRARMREELVKLQDNLEITTIYVTHDQVEAMTMADRLAVMDLGVLQQVGTPKEVYERPRTEFVGGTANRLGIYDGPPKVRLGIRPESIAVSKSPVEGNVKASVHHLEPQGERTILGARLAGEEIFLVEVPPEFEADLDEGLYLQFRQPIHIFSTTDGMNLTY